MGRRAWAVAIAVAMAIVGVGPAGAAPPARQDVIVVFDDDVRDPRTAAADVARQHDARVTHVYEHVFGGFAASIPEGRRGALARDPRVARVDDDRPVHATTDTVPTGVARISAPAAHDARQTGTGVSVGILDTGIATHPDLHIAGGGKNCTDSGGTSTNDVQGHGTHVAGTVAALANGTGVLGVAPDVSLVPVKVLGDTGSGQWSWIICGLDHAAATGVDVANLSLSGSGSWDGTPCPGTESLHKAVCGAIAAGTTVVVAAGNDSRDASNNVPAAYPEAITVSALEDRNGEAEVGYCSGRGPWQTCEDVFASFSNYGSVIDVSAPGVAILSTTNDGGTGSKSGTSMAAPHVAGVAALVVGAHGPMTPAALRDHLRATGQCPDTKPATDGACSGQSWPRDPDGVAEPLVHAAWAVAGGDGGGGGGGGGDTNTAPTADFTFSCTDLACSFTDVSADSDGTIASRVWDFGDGASSTATNPSHTYAAGGDYTVTLTVTDDDGATDSTPKSVTVAAPSEAGDITLAVATRKVTGTKYADLAWSGATTAVDIWVDGSRRVSASVNDGQETLSLGKGGGTHTFRVCEAGGTTTCSEAVTASW